MTINRSSKPNTCLRKTTILLADRPHLLKPLLHELDFTNTAFQSYNNSSSVLFSYQLYKVIWSVIWSGIMVEELHNKLSNISFSKMKFGHRWLTVPWPKVQLYVQSYLLCHAQHTQQHIWHYLDTVSWNNKTSKDIFRIYFLNLVCK